MKKRLLSLALALVVTLALLPATALAADPTSGSCGGTATWSYDASTKTLTISGTGAMDDYYKSYYDDYHDTNLISPWNSFAAEIQTITIGSGITAIGAFSFEGCTQLSSVTIPSSVTEIHDYAFQACHALTSITIPEGVTSIWDGAFSSCRSLATVTLPSSVRELDGEVFNFSYALTDINVDSGNPSYTSADGVVFSKDMTKLIVYPAGKTASSYAVPSTVTIIGKSAFRTCRNLTSITLPDGITDIEFGAFWGCEGISAIKIPKTVNVVAPGAFGYNLSLSQIEVDAGNAAYAAVDGVLLSKDQKTLVAYPGGKSDSSYSVPDGVTTIDEWAFSWCLNLGSITLPASVNSLGGAAFGGCSALEKITIPNGVQTLPEALFVNCVALTEVTLPNTVTDIIYGVFDGCGALSDINYRGTISQWQLINIAEGNEQLEVATIQCTNGNIIGGQPVPTPETKPGEWGLGKEATLPDGTKYVPYSTSPRPSSIGWSGCRYLVLDGALPSGLTLNADTCVISGIPQASGTFKFTIQQRWDDPTTGGSWVDTACTLTILDTTNKEVNTKENDYEITQPIGREDAKDPNNFLKNSYTDETLVIEGPYDEFMNLYLDGGKLTRNTDYSAREGSTRITIRANTFRRAGEGQHTIAAEFRAGGKPSGTLKTVAQNYTLTLPRGGGSSSRRPSQHTEKADPAVWEEILQKRTMPFGDVSSTDWFYSDLLWAYQLGLIQGVDLTHFAPKEPVSQAVIVTILARLAKVDLTQFANAQEPGIGEGYFKEAAIWARRSGLLPKDTAFTGKEALTRDGMAVMLSQYLASMGEDVSAPANPVAFADAAAMSARGGAAFQTLYSRGIFQGTGGMKMDPTGTTTRAQFVALVHRINLMLEN